MSDLPGASSLKKLKWQWWAIGGIGAVGVVWYATHRKPATPVDPGLDPNDPSLFGDAFTTDQGVSLVGYTDPSTGAFIGGTGGNTVNGPSTNAQWAQQAVAYLSTQGFTPGIVSVALGKYLFGAGLSDSEMGIVQAAIAFEGYPPTAVPAPHVSAPSGQTPAGFRYATESHHTGPTARTVAALVQQFSDPAVRTATNLSIATGQTVADPRNIRLLPYYTAHRAAYPPNAIAFFHVVKRS